VLALFGVAVGTMQPDDAALGRIALALGRRSSLRLERLRAPARAAGLPVVPVPAPAATSSPATPAAPAVAAPPAAAPRVHDVAGRRAGVVFRPDVLPIDVEAKRAVASLGSAATPELQLAAVEHLRALAPQLLGLHDTGPVAEAIAALDHLLTTTQEPALLAAIDQTALALSDRALVERMVRRLGEPRVPPEERETLVAAAGGREIAGPAMPALKDESVSVRVAAARAIAAGGDPASSTVLIRRLEQEPDEGVLAELLRAIGRLGAIEALEVLARYAEPG